MKVIKHHVDKDDEEQNASSQLQVIFWIDSRHEFRHTSEDRLFILFSFGQDEQYPPEERDATHKKLESVEIQQQSVGEGLLKSGKPFLLERLEAHGCTLKIPEELLLQKGSRKLKGPWNVGWSCRIQQAGQQHPMLRRGTLESHRLNCRTRSLSGLSTWSTNGCSPRRKRKSKAAALCKVGHVSICWTPKFQTVLISMMPNRYLKISEWQPLQPTLQLGQFLHSGWWKTCFAQDVTRSVFKWSKVAD